MPGVGLIDDIFVITTIFKQVGADIEKYKMWKAENIAAGEELAIGLNETLILENVKELEAIENEDISGFDEILISFEDVELEEGDKNSHKEFF